MQVKNKTETIHLFPVPVSQPGVKKLSKIFKWFIKSTTWFNYAGVYQTLTDFTITEHLYG